MKIDTHIKKVIDELKRLKAPETTLNEFQVFLVSYQDIQTQLESIETMNQSFYHDLKTINIKHVNDLDHLLLSKKENEEKFVSEKETFRNNYIESLHHIDQDYLKQKKAIEKKYQDEKTQLLDDIKSYENEKNKQDSLIIKNIQEIKKKYEAIVLTIEDKTAEKISKVTENLKESITKIEDQIHLDITNYEIQYKQLIESREKESTSHDTDYIDIKSHYNILNKTLNKQINVLKHKKTLVMKSLEDEYEGLIKPLDTRIENLEFRANELKTDRIQKRDFEIQKFQDRKTLEIERYEEQRNKTIAQTAEAVSLLNSKLSNYREITNEKKRKIVRDFQTKSMSSNHETLQKNRELSYLDNDLNQFIIKTRKEIKIKKSEGQLLLFELHKNHQILIADIEFLIKKELYTTTFDLRKIDIELKHDQEKIMDQKQRLLQEKAFYKNSVEAAYQKDILSYETQINLASQTQERDLGQLVLDASIDITYIDKNMIEIQSRHDHLILTQKHQIEILDFQLEKELAMIQTHKSQQLDQASRTRDLDLEETQLRLDLKQETFDEQTAAYKYKLDALFIHYEKDLSHNESRYEYQKDNLKREHEFKSTKRQLIFNAFESKVNLRRIQMDFYRSEQVIDVHVDLFYGFIQQMLLTQFKAASLLMSCVQLLEQTFQYHENPETMRQMIDALQYIHKDIISLTKDKMTKLKEAFHVTYQTHFENAKSVVLMMHQKDEQQLNDDYIQKRQQEKTELLKKKYDLEVLMKQFSNLKDEQALKRIEKAYSKINSDLETIEQDIHDATNQEQYAFEQFKTKFLQWTNKKFNHYQHILKKLMRTEQYSNDFFNHIEILTQKLSQTLYYTNQVIFGMTKSVYKQYHKFIELQQFQQPKIYHDLLSYQHDMQQALIQEKHNKTTLIQQDIDIWQENQDQLQASYDQELNFSRRTFRENIVAKKNDAEHKITQYHREFNEARDKRLKSIQKLETSLQQFASKKTSTLETLQFNQKAMVEQENIKLTQQEQALLLNQVKSLENLEQNHVKKQHNYDEKITNALNSIEQRLIKYLSFVSKLRENYKDKMIDKTLYETKLRQNHKKRVLHSKQKTSRLISTHKKEKRLHLIHLDKHEKREQTILNKKHQSIEFWLKKSYQFKLKSLDVN